MTLQASNVTNLYHMALARVLAFGSEVSPRGQKTRELRGAHLTLTNPLANLIVSPERKMNYAFGVAEFLWILSGMNDVETITQFNKQIANFSDDGTYMRGAYGPKIIEQLPYVESSLRADPDSRQALLTIWRERPGPTKDVPCTTLMQFMIRNDALEMLVYMRSNDLWLGFPYDVYGFTQLQNYLAHRLGVALGPYHHIVGSLHVYEQHWEKADRVLQEDVSWTPESLPFTSDFDLATRAAFLNTATKKEFVPARHPEWDVLLSVLARKFSPHALTTPTFEGLANGRTK